MENQNIELVRPCPKCSVFIRLESRNLGKVLKCPSCKEEVIVTDERKPSTSSPRQSMIDKAMNYLNKDQSEKILKERAEKKEAESNRRKEMNIVKIENLQKDVAWGVFWGLCLFIIALPIALSIFWAITSLAGIVFLAS